MIRAFSQGNEPCPLNNLFLFSSC